MSKVVKQVEVSEGADKVAGAVKALVLSAKQALSDGFQPGQDLPKIASENFAGLVGAMGSVGQLGAEASEDLGAFLKAWGLVGVDLGVELAKKPPAPAA